jgi:metal-responsive CopG/Arc/MetJ family transcriptional regulator
VAKVKVDKDLLERVKRHAEQKGYASVEEFVAHVLDKAIAADESGESEEERRKKLEGLGYIG